MPRKEQVECEVEEVEIVTEGRQDQPGIEAKCTRCDHVTQSFGTGEGSVKRCLALMNEECPFGEDNFYINQND